jgi:hypothetical protein
MLAGALRDPALAAQAGRIDSIAPSCASVGARVTVSGIGFGGKNVRVAVDDVPAGIVAATGDHATFIVPPGVRLGPTVVSVTNPGGHVGTIPFSGVRPGDPGRLGRRMDGDDQRPSRRR